MRSKGAVPLIGIVDNDQATRESLSALVRAAGYESAIFESAQSFLASYRKHDMDCLVVDFQMPGVDWLQLQRLLVEMRYSTPIVLVSADDAEIRERALKQGIIALFGKPFNDEALLSAIQSALLGIRRSRLLLADDHAGIPKSLRAILTEEFDLVGEATSGERLLEVAARLSPDVVVLDTSMPGSVGPESVSLLREYLPMAAIVVLTTYQNPSSSERAHGSAVDAYVVRTQAASDLIPTIRRALATRRARPRA